MADSPAIDAILDSRFGPARHNRTAYRLRDGTNAIPDLCLVARDGDALIGSVQCWPLQLRGSDGRLSPLVLLGPVAVALSHDGVGVGTLLMTEALARADAAGLSPMLLIGDEPYYGRFGFTAAATGGWQVPGPVDRARLLLRGSAEGLPVQGRLEPATKDRAAA
ncbi:GNAT family N-acetyltransferase [Polymorphobacter sp.]|uniref:GNAT family N-acetyltransferase n=1 Tax=Polymorphobacter sp. TaxID=1909290 RepID=UPI003F6E9A15